MKMQDSKHESIRSTPNYSVSSASRVATAPELMAADRKVGWLVVNKWTYRLMRLVSNVVTPKFDVSEVSISEEINSAKGMRIVQPDIVRRPGALFLIHGGGFVIGSNRDILSHATQLARKLGVPVFCPAYRLAPEAPFPSGFDDCHFAWHWLHDNSESFDIDPSKIVLGGVSAGGGLAASLVQRLHDEGKRKPSAQCLIYPMLDARTATIRELDKPRHRVWSNRNNLFGWASYLTTPLEHPAPIYAVPAQREELSGLPPTWLGVGTSDLFLDEDREYARRLSAAGVDVSYVEVDGAIHGFDMVDTGMSNAFIASQMAFIERFI